jgi:hypothetical protein
MARAWANAGPARVSATSVMASVKPRILDLISGVLLMTDSGKNYAAS